MPRAAGSSSKQSQGASLDQRKETQNGPPTHFLCIPLVTSASRASLQDSIRAFRNDILRNGISEAAVRPIGSVHLTIGVMCLPTEDSLQDACQLLEGLDISTLLNGTFEGHVAINQSIGSAELSHAEEIPTEETPLASLKASISPPDTGHQGPADHRVSETTKPLEVSLRSLYSMRDPLNTSILYAHPEDASGRLLPFCEKLHDVFKNAGILRNENRALKLHATVFNGQHARVRVPGKAGKVPLSIDATALLKRWKDTSWTGSFELEKVAICRMRAEDVYDASGAVVDKEYTEVTSVPLPSSALDKVASASDAQAQTDYTTP